MWVVCLLATHSSSEVSVCSFFFSSRRRHTRCALVTGVQTCARPILPNHEPRGCSRGASYSWYLYSGNRLKYPLIRARLLELWREARRTHAPVNAWASIAEDPVKSKHYKSIRGMGGFVRTTWEEVNEIIGAANVYTIKEYGPDRVAGVSPIPAMSMIYYAAGTRHL